MSAQLPLDFRESRRRPQQVHRHSRAAYRLQLAAVASRAGMVWRCIRDYGPMTDRQVAATLGFAELAKVQPRISELIQADMLEECGERKCPQTGMTVRVVRVKA